MMNEAIEQLVTAIGETRTVAATREQESALEALQELGYRGRKLRRAWGRPQCLGFFGPSQAGKSFLVGALLSHELGTLEVLAGDRPIDFLEEINPAKGVESTGVVTRFSTGPTPAPLKKGDFLCRLLGLDVMLESLATGFLVECTSPGVDPERVERVMRDARLQTGGKAHPRLRTAWDTVWHNLQKKYQNRHAYLNDLRRHPELRKETWKDSITTVDGWLKIYTLLWGGAGYAKDLDGLLRRLVEGLEQLGHGEMVEVDLAHIRASAAGTSLIDAACLNALGQTGATITVFNPEASRDVTIDPGILAALIAEVRLPLKPVAGSLLDHADMLDFPGGRALKGINGFGADELNSGALENAIEVYKRGKLTYLFEQFSLDREITALVLCSPGPTKPEAIQLQSQVERWLQIRHGSATPSDSDELTRPSLFLALTKFDMSLGALRSDNATNRWNSRVGEACVDFWARNAQSWINNWGGGDRPFTNTYWVCNPYADQMRTLRVGDPDYETVKAGYFKSSAVQRYIADPETKWAALEGEGEGGLPRSGIPLLSSALRTRMQVDMKGKELLTEAINIHRELLGVLKDLTPSRDEAEARQRIIDNATTLVDAMREAMALNYRGAVFGEFVDRLVVPLDEVEEELRNVYSAVAPMSIKTSDKVKKVLVHILKWWVNMALERFRASELPLPITNVERFLRQVCTSRTIMPVLGKAVFPYFSRKELNYGLIASILQVKICDGLLTLFATRPRRTPSYPVRLSFSENAGSHGTADGGEADADAVDWGDVDFDEEPDEAVDTSVDIIFAGNRFFHHWADGLGEFYLKTTKSKSADSLDDPHIQRLLGLLRQMENSALAEAR